MELLARESVNQNADAVMVKTGILKWQDRKAGIIMRDFVKRGVFL
jgi:hypothetical protein